MSRPFRIVSLSLLAVSLGFAGCKTSTPYTAMYSPGKSYFVAPPEKKDKAVEALLTATEPEAPAPVSGLPEGLPPPAAPAADPLAPPPGL